MDPNEYGLIRQREKTLIALFYYVISNVEEYHVELIHPTYIKGSYISSNDGAISTPLATSPQQCAKVDVSAYDFIIAPCSLNITPETRTGLSVDSNSGFIDTMFIAGKSLSPVDMAVFGVFDRRANTRLKILNINCKRDIDTPILCFKRHRSDNVNPKGLIKDVNSDILQPVKKDKLNSEADRIRDELPGNAESPDLDSKSGSGADERADS